MSTKRLGKGLGALIRSNEIEDKKTKNKNNKSKNSAISNILLKDVKPNPNQPRRYFDDNALEELILSIQEKGVITPITVREIKEGYEIIAGERRWRASKKANKSHIPAYVIGVKNDSEIMEISLIENIQREDLNPIEEAEAYMVLSNKYGLSHKDIAQKVGKKRVTVSNSMRLLKLPPEIRKSLRDGHISQGHARAILQAKTNLKMHNLWKKILRDKLSVRATEALSKKKYMKTKKESDKIKRLEPNLKSTEDILIETLGTKVKIKHLKSSGYIEIFYFSDDDLERIVDLLTSKS